jgi:hypothetical protein
MKKLFYGILIGAVVAFPLGINYGRDVPLWSNPFAYKRSIPEKIKDWTGQQMDDTKSAIHEATKPLQKGK